MTPPSGVGLVRAVNVAVDPGATVALLAESDVVVSGDDERQRDRPPRVPGVPRTGDDIPAGPEVPVDPARLPARDPSTLVGDEHERERVPCSLRQVEADICGAIDIEVVDVADVDTERIERAADTS